MVERVPRGAVFLDRDGVLLAVTEQDGVTHPPASAEALQLLAGVEEAVSILRSTGARVIVVTNQPDIARGRQTRAGLQAINDRLASLVPVDAILVCPHDNADDCDCRKPKPGLLTQGARRFGADLSCSIMVGDRITDVRAGHAAGCASVLLAEDPASCPEAEHVALSLLAAVPWIVKSLR